MLDTAAGTFSPDLERSPRTWLIEPGTTRIIVGIFFLMVASFVLSAALMRQLNEARDWVFHTREIQSKIDEITWDTLALQNGLRGYILTGNDAQLALRDKARAELLPDLADLAELMGENASYQREVDNLRRLAQERLERVDTIVEVRRREGMEAARTLAETDNDANLTAAIAQLRGEEEQVLHDHLSSERRNSQFVFGALILSVTAASSLIFITAFLMNRTLALRDAILGEQKALLAQKDLMMREVDHRVRNSLTLIYTLLTLHRRQAADNDTLAVHLDDAAHRVLTVAKIHERLYKSETPDRVEIGQYVRELCCELVASLAKGDAALVHVEATPVAVAGEIAILLGLIVTELVTNALKYGGVSTAAPIEVSLERTEAGLSIIVADHGQGLSPDFTPEASQGLGMQVVLMLVRQLGGDLSVDRAWSGARFVVVIPMPGLIS
ncbi:sensor histidine kinase [Microvirga massiliensis]|uniref:sensor histidine kinase n=1 Tax=Microvirga massiliensis TaxID=1033741 RepID=UPI0006607F03|nr:histidine kinase dimerization/phosphoacceptor domain -containing protein [Microvirga massiliensis]